MMMTMWTIVLIGTSKINSLECIMTLMIIKQCVGLKIGLNS